MHQALYDTPAEACPILRFLLPGCAPLLRDPIARRRLAVESSHFFIKTHELPFDQYFPGERVILVIRHPGPALLSYYTLLNRDDIITPSRSPCTKEAAIDGCCNHGDWSVFLSSYYRSGLGQRCHVIRYEDLGANYHGILEKLARFLALPFWPGDPIAFSKLKATNPRFYRRGTNRDYERYYSRAQLLRLWERHGAMARLYGYSPPDLSLAGKELYEGHS